MLILGIYSFSTYSEGICSVGKARVALSGSAGPLGGSLPAAGVGGRTPSKTPLRCWLPVRPDCACK